MRKGILIIILIILPFIMGIHPRVANSETFVTGGGIITEGHGKDTNRIIFGVSVFTDETGMPSTGSLQINFLNTYYSLTGLDNFDKKIFKGTEITGGVIETRYWGDDPNKPYTFIRIESNGRLNGVVDWYTVVRFADDPVGEDGAILPDAVRISIFDPSGEHVYDTAAGQAGYDYPRDHSWRTFLDGGNVNVFYDE